MGIETVAALAIAILNTDIATSSLYGDWNIFATIDLERLFIATSSLYGDWNCKGYFFEFGSWLQLPRYMGIETCRQ